MSKRTILLLVIGAIAALVVGWQVIAFAGPVGTASGFEDDDGNLAPNGTTPNFDWNSFNPTTWTGLAPNRQSGKVVSGWTFKGIEDAQATNSDNGFAGGTKQDQNCPSVTGAKAPNKDDLRRIYLSTKNVGGDVFLNLAWVRIPQNTTSSSAHVAFEFNKGSTPCGAGSGGLVQRSAGDMLIVYDFEGGGNTPVLTLRRWVTSPSAQCEISSNSAPCWGTATNLTAGGFAEARVNTTGPVTDTIGPTTPQTLGNSEFGEAGINLSAAGVFTPGACENFGQAYAVSRSSGNSGTAQMKDLVGPGDFRLGNCATVITRKVTSPAGDTTTNFGYTTNVTTNPATTTSPFSLKHGDSKTINNVVTGSGKTVTENDPGPGYALTGIDCTASSVPAANRSTNTTTRTVTFSIAAGETLDCTFTNTKQQGTIVVEKVTTGGSGAFEFTSGSLSPSPFTLTTTEEGQPGKDSRTFSDLNPGTYDVAEDIPAGWDLTSATCDDGSEVDAISLSANETVTCTFNDTKLGGITVEKVTTGGSGAFEFTSGSLSPSPFTLTTTEEGQPGKDSRTFSDLNPGTYDVAEDIPAGWDLTSATCTDGSEVDAINLAAGESITCTFNDTKLGGITVEKVTTGGSGAFDFTSGSLSPSAFTLTTTQEGQAGKDSRTFSDLDPGTYDVAEDVPAGWDLTSATCDDGSEVDAINLAAGESITCTFTNTKKTTTLGTEQSFTPQDTATITGAGTGTPNGTVDFKLYKGPDCDPANSELVYSEDNVSLDGDNKAKTNNSTYTISDEGTSEYHWDVSYADDTNGFPDASSCVEESTVTIDNDNTP